MSAFSLRPDDASRPEVAALIARHFQLMRETSPPESCHVMDASELTAAGAVLYSLSNGGAVIGIGALKPLGDGHGEIKSMHVATEARGRGASKALLEALLEKAGSEGMSRVSLETGVEDAFIAARGLYTRYGFVECAPFGDYIEDPLSVFMTKAL